MSAEATEVPAAEAARPVTAAAAAAEASSAPADAVSAATPSSPSKGRRDGFPKGGGKSPEFTMRHKPKMIIGGAVPSWQASIPGPKYNCEADVFKKKAPVYSMRTKPEMVVGGGVPSWTKSIPGPKYTFDTDCYKERQPVYSMQGRGDAETKAQMAKSAPQISPDDLKKGLNASRPTPPEWSLKSRPSMIVGGEVPSWTRSIPGPKYTFETEVYKDKKPVYSIGKKLPTESDMMKVRSPGPTRYGGSASDAKIQSEVDSTRSKSFSCSFGIGSRWEGRTAAMARSGALTRFNRPA